MIARPVGSSVRLKCTASGNPRPDIVWLKDDRLLTEQEVGEGRQKRWTLSLRNLMPEHSGRYTCRVSNRAGEINATYKVEVIREYPTERHTKHVHLETLGRTDELITSVCADHFCEHEKLFNQCNSRSVFFLNFLKIFVSDLPSLDCDQQVLFTSLLHG